MTLGRRWWIVILQIALVAVPLAAQRGGWRFRAEIGALPYDGRFTIVRLWYPYYEGWAFDWPDMERNFGLILSDLTAIPVNPNGSNILRMDDPELFKYPQAYLSEPGYWHPSDAEVLGLRTWLEKGGFLFVDDFHYANEWGVFEVAMSRVLPQGQIVRLGLEHPIFHTFFEIKSLDLPYPGSNRAGLIGEFYGIHEDNDPRKRLMVVINYNMDIGDYMEYRAGSRYPVDPTSEAYKFGVNYVIYGLTR
jgi:hypothetical protein